MQFRSKIEKWLVHEGICLAQEVQMLFCVQLTIGVLISSVPALSEMYASVSDVHDSIE